MLIIKDNKEIEDRRLSEFMWEDSFSAFIKLEFIDGEYKWIIYSSSGEKITEVDSRDQGFVIARCNDISICSAH